MRVKSLPSCLTLRSYGLWPTRLLCLWDCPGKNTRVGCHTLLQGDLHDLGIATKSLSLQAGSLPLAPPLVDEQYCDSSRCTAKRLSSVQSPSHGRLFATPRTAARQASQPITNSRNLRRDSTIHIHLSILPQTPFPSRLPYNTEQSSLCYTVGGKGILVYYILV